MTPRLTTDYAKNYCNRILIVQVILENVVACFWGHSVFVAARDSRRVYDKNMSDWTLA